MDFFSEASSFPGSNDPKFAFPHGAVTCPSCRMPFDGENTMRCHQYYCLEARLNKLEAPIFLESGTLDTLTMMLEGIGLVSTYFTLADNISRRFILLQLTHRVQTIGNPIFVSLLALFRSLTGVKEFTREELLAFVSAETQVDLETVNTVCMVMRESLHELSAAITKAEKAAAASRR